MRKTAVSMPPVIVRGYRGEPVKLVAHAFDALKNRVFVGKPNAKNPISLPVALVFDFDQRVFELLTRAHKSGDMSRLNSLYDDVAVDEIICIKYKDNIPSVHDQERVTDSRNSPEGHS